MSDVDLQKYSRIATLCGRIQGAASVLGFYGVNVEKTGAFIEEQAKELWDLLKDGP